jgi:hypothetical protein
VRTALDRLRRLAALPRPERRLLLEAAGALALITASLKLLRNNPLLSGLATLAGHRPPPVTPEQASSTIGRTRRLVSVASRYGICRGSCLSRSTTLWWLLRRRGIRTELRVGVRKEGDQLHAHAWIEHEGVAINERLETLRRYAPFHQRLAE